MARTNSAQKILYSASLLFAQHGFSGTIMDELAQLAGVNKATIYYHFKSKENLYEEVLAQHLKLLADAVTTAVSKEATALDKLHAYVTTFAEQNSQRVPMTSIMMREIAGGGTTLPNCAKKQMHTILMTVKSIILQGVNEGIFINVSPMVIHFMVIGSLSFYITSEPMRKMMVSSDPEIQEAFKNSSITEVTEQLSIMIKNALLKKEQQ